MTSASARPGWIRSAAAVAWKDLILEWRSPDRLLSMGLFSLLVLVIFNFALGLGVIREVGPERLLPGVFWVTLLFASLTGLLRSFQLEQTHDALAGILASPADPTAVYAGKSAASLSIVALLELCLLPLCALVFNTTLGPRPWTLAAVVGLHTLGLVALGSLLAGVTSRTGRGEVVLALLFLPAAVPLFLSAVRCTEALLAGQSLSAVATWLQVAAGLDVLYVLVAFLTFEAVLEV